MLFSMNKFMARLYCFEKILAIYFFFGYIFLALYGFKFNYLLNLLFYQLFVYLSMGYLILGLYFIFLILRHRNVSIAIDLVKSYFNFPFLSDAIRIILTNPMILIIFCNLKQIIPVVNPRLFDQELWQADTILHFHLSPTLFFLQIPREHWFWPFMDYCYPTYFLMIVFVLWIFMLQRKSEMLRNQIVTAICLIWIIGGIIYFLCPAMGPCYYKPELFKKLNIPITRTLQDWLLFERKNFLKDSKNYHFKSFYGIAAMPCLHIALGLTLTLFSRKLNKFLFLLLFFYCFLIFAGSIMLGWHYAIDNYAGILLAYLVYRIVTGRKKI